MNMVERNMTNQTIVYRDNGHYIKRSAMFLKYLSFLMGVFITMPIVAIRISSFMVSIFNIIFMLFIIYTGMQFFLSIKSIKLNKTSKILIIWLIGTLVSSFFGLLYFNTMPEWFIMVKSYMFKIILYIILIVFISSSKDRDIITKNFIKGFYIGCIFNIAWAIIEGVIFYVFKFSLNNKIFTDYINSLPPDRKFITITSSYGIRTPGFNYDPAHLGGIVPIVVLYTLLEKKYFVLILALSSLAFSQSTTALVSSILLIVININKIISIKRKIKFKPSRMLTIAFAVFSLIIVTIIIYNSNLKIGLIESLKNNIQGFSNRISNVYIDDKKTNIRTLYHILVPVAIYHNGLRMLTGTGFGTASYPYVFNDHIKDQFNMNLGYTAQGAYDPESTYISYLFDTGIIGLLIYVIILYMIYKHYNQFWKNGYNSLIFSSISGVIMSGFFYHYTLTAYQILIIIIASISMRKMNEKV